MFMLEIQAMQHVLLNVFELHLVHTNKELI